MTWFDRYRADWRKGSGMDEQGGTSKVIDKVNLELDTIEKIYRMLRDLGPTARVRVFRYVSEILGEDP